MLQAFHLRHLVSHPWTECNFTIKDLLCNFGCRLLERSLIKSVILLAYILYCLKKYTSRGCAYFVEWFLNLHLSLQRLPVVLVHPHVQTWSHKVLVTLSRRVDSKLTEKSLQVFFSHLPIHTWIFEDIWRAPFFYFPWHTGSLRTKVLSYYYILLHHSRVGGHLKFTYSTGDIRLYRVLKITFTTFQGW